jgi:hypothetical protein
MHYSHESRPEERMVPGATLSTLTPEEDHSTARVFVRLSTAALAAPVCAIVGNPFHIFAITFTITPMDE